MHLAFNRFEGLQVPMTNRPHILEKTRVRLWVNAGGRCEYEGCNVALWRDELTRKPMNSAYIAHIVAFEPNGPRGDEILSPQLARELSNLMLMCDSHHRLIDEVEVAEHSRERLLAMKASHEERIETLTGIQSNRKTHIVLYGPNVGSHNAILNFQCAANALKPEYYPAGNAIELSMRNAALTDDKGLFWEVEREQLVTLFEQRVRPILKMQEPTHISVFAVAPQPLLILLGTLLTDIPTVEVRHLFREPANWKWREHTEDACLKLQEPESTKGVPALVIALSASVEDARIKAVLGDDVSIWRLTVSSPRHDCLPSKLGLSKFRELARIAMNKIKAKHGQNAVLHVFPAMGVSAAVEFGRIRQPKADLAVKIYDQNNRQGRFIPCLELSESEKKQQGE